MLRLPPISTLFPYTTLFRSEVAEVMSCALRMLEAMEWWPLFIGGAGGDAMCATLYAGGAGGDARSEEHTSELQSHHELVCRLLLEKKNVNRKHSMVYETSTS